MKKLIFTLAMALLSGAGIMAADYYWVGGTGNWSDYANHWATSSGGAGFHALAPTQTDNVFFDANSFTATGQIVTVMLDAVCADMNWTGVTNNPTLQGIGSQKKLNIYGSMTLDENMNFSSGITLYFKANSGSKTIFTAGKVLRSVDFDGSGSWALLDGLNVGGSSITFVKGTLVTNDHPINAGTFNSTSSEIRSLSLGASTITLSGGSYTTLYMNCSNLIFNAGASMIEFSGSGGEMYVYGANLTFYDVLFSSPTGNARIYQPSSSQVHTFNNLTFNGNGRIENSNIIGTLTFSPGKMYTLNSGVTQTILNDLIANGNSAAMIHLSSGSGQATIYKESGAVVADYVSLQGINATGGASFTANNSLDMGNNSGWTINPPTSADFYWVGGTGNWNDPAHWALSSGGAGGAGVPTMLNNVFFDANSFTAVDQTVTIVGDVTNSVNCRNMNWAGVTNNPTLAGTSSLKIFGSLTLTPNMSYDFTGAVFFKAIEMGQTIFTAGKFLDNSIYFDGEGGEWTLMDGLNIGIKHLQFERGTLNTNNQEVFADRIYSYYSHQRTLNLGSSVITLSYSSQSYQNYTLDLRGSNLSLNAGTSLIKFTGANARLNSKNQSGLVYYDVIFENPNGSTQLSALNGIFNSVVFNGGGSVNYNNTTGTMTFSPGKQYSLGGTINIVNDLIANGTETEFINISGGTISKSSGEVTVNWVSLQNSTATGGAIFTANNSLDMGGNTGWIINPPPPKSYYWIGGTGNYNDAAHWSLSSGGDGGAGVPTVLDNVFFDANSFTATGQTVTFVGDASNNVNCRDMDWTGVTNNPTMAGSHNLRIYGSLTLSPDMSRTYSGTIYFEATEAGKTVLTGGLVLNSNIYFQGEGGGWTLMDGLNIGSNNLYFVRGSLNTNDQPVSVGRFLSNYSNNRVLTLGSSIVSIFGSYSYSYEYAFNLNSTNLIFDAGTSTLKFTGNDARFSTEGAALTFYDVLFDNANGWLRFYSNNDNTFNSITFNGNGDLGGQTIGTLTLAPGKIYRFGVQDVTTIQNDLVAIGNENEYIIIECLLDDDWTTSIFKESGEVTVEYVTLRGINATGGASFTANNSIDMGNNTGWIINPPPPKSYYWIGGTGNYNDAAHWSLSSGGDGGAGVPTVLDNVFFDANSFTAAGQTVTLVGDTSNNVNCRDMDWTGVNYYPTLAGTSSQNLRIYGSLTLSPDMSRTYSGTIYFEATEAGKTVLTGGLVLNSNIYFQGEGGGWTLMDGLNIGSNNLYFVRGSLNTNDQPVSVGRFLSNYSNNRVLTLGSSIVSIFGSYSYYSYEYAFNLNSTNLIFSEGTSLLIFAGSDARIRTAGSELTFYNLLYNNESGWLRFYTSNSTFNSLTFNGNGDIYDNLTIGTLNLASGKQYTFSSSQTQTILNDLVANGSCAAPIVIQSSSTSQKATISKSTGTVSVSFCSLSGIKATGGAEFIAENSIDLGNNSGWTFTSVPQDLYWVGGLGEWNDVTHWSAVSGGEGGYCVPTKIDNVNFDANSFTQTAQAVFVNVANAECRNMDWTGALNEPTITSSSPNNNLKIYGSLLLNPAMNFTFSGSVYFEGESPAKDTWEINMAGESFSNAVYFNGIGSVWTLLDALTITGNDLYLNYGTLNTNGKNVSVRQFISNNNNVRMLNMGASVFSASSPLNQAWYAAGNNFAIDPGTSEIRITGANGGFWSTGASPLSYNKVHFQSAGGNSTLNSSHTFDEIIFNPAGKIMGAGNFGDVQFNASGEIAGNNTFGDVSFFGNSIINGSNSFGALLFSPGTTNVLQAGAVQTIAGAFNFWGNAAMPIAIHSSTPGTQATISKSSEVVSGNYILLQDMNATGGATFDVYNSEDLGNNTGWNFLEPPEATCPLDMEVCENLPPFVLNTAAPAGGVYSGEGVYYDDENGHYMFDPAAVVGEQSVITYAIGGLFPDSCEYVIVILPLPVVECPDDMEVCAGSDYINLYVGEGLFYLNEIMITGFDPLEAGTFVITYTETNGCGSTSCDFIIEVLALPEIVITGELEFCEGGSSILSASGGLSYIWNTNATTSEIEVAVSGNYSVTGTDENGCENTTEVFVTVFPLPTAVITGELNLCEGESTLLTASGGVSYLWSTGETTSSITVSEAGEYSVTVVDEHGCEKMASVMLTVNPLPDVEITGEFEFCEGDAPFTLTGGLPVGGIYYVDGVETTVFNPASPGNYELIYEYSDAFSCIGSATTEITVHPLPIVTLEEFPDFCAGAEPITLSGGQPEGGNYFIDTTGASTFNPAIAGVYEVMYEYANAFSCVNSAMGEIVVHPLPEVEITGNFSFCISASTELTASEGVSYLWSTSETTQSIIVTATGVYSVLVTDINGCEGYAEATVTEEDNQPPTIIAPPDIVLAADIGLCYASNVNLDEPETDDNCGIASIANDAPEVFPVGETIVTWTVTDLAGNFAQDVQLVTVLDEEAPTISAPADLSVPVDAVGEFCAASNVELGEPIVDDNCSFEPATNDAPFIFPLGTTEVTWTVTDAAGNFAQAVQLVTVTSDFVAEISGDFDFCDGQSTLLTATEGVSCLWNTGDTTQSITVYDSGIFSVVVTAPSGCEAYAETEVIVYPIPEIEIEGNLILCEGESSVLTASAGVSYLWSTGETSQFITVSSEGDYSVAVTDENGCVGQNSVFVNVHPLPVAAITPDGPIVFCEGGSVELTASGGETYAWSTGETSQTIIVTLNGLYGVTVFNEFGCESSAKIFVNVIELPEVTCPPTQQAYLDEAPVILDLAVPAGGIYSGMGVYADQGVYYFDAAIGMGSYEISYCYTDPETNCENCCTFIYRVNPLEQELCIPVGWSGISSYFQPNIPIAELFAPLTMDNKVHVMLGKTGIFWPAHNVNTLTDWDVYQGYKIKMIDSGCIQISGIIPENKTINLGKGANFMPVLCNQPVDADEIFDQLGEDLLFAFDLYNNQLYWPLGGIYTLDTLEPGIGYLVKMINSGQTTFNCGNKAGIEYVAKNQPPAYTEAPWVANATGSAHFISILKEAMSDFRTGDFVGAFTNEGKCVGIAQYTGDDSNMLLTVYGDDFTTGSKDGLSDGEKMSFRLYHISEKTELQLDVVFDLEMPNAGNFTEFGQSVIKRLKVGSLSAENHENENIINIYPNPSKDIINIETNFEMMKITLINYIGQEVFAVNLDQKFCQLNITGNNPGIYFIHIHSADGVIVTRRVTIY